jgi:hypothetical protein
MAVFGQHVSAFIEEITPKDITRQNVAVASVWRFARGEDVINVSLRNYAFVIHSFPLACKQIDVQFVVIVFAARD